MKILFSAISICIISQNIEKFCLKKNPTYSEKEDPIIFINKGWNSHKLQRIVHEIIAKEILNYKTELSLLLYGKLDELEWIKKNTDKIFINPESWQFKENIMNKNNLSNEKLKIEITSSGLKGQE